MPYSSIAEARKDGFPTKAEGIDLTLAQINKLADIYDSVKKGGGADNPMAVAKTQWKKLYRKEGGKWVRKQRASELTIVNAYVSGEVRRTTWQGKDYLIAPVVAIIEGVLHGSQGPALYLAEEFSKYAEAWNGVPLPVLHPKDNEGNYVSANEPEIIERQSVGNFFNAFYENGKLKGELWIDIDKAKRIAPEVLNVEKGMPLEVSTSLWSDDEQIHGEWNGKAYDSIVRNIRPDHVALLPGGEGACNWEQGCGAPRVNKGGDRMENNKNTDIEPKPDGKMKQILSQILKPFGFNVHEASHDDIKGQLQKIMDAQDKEPSAVVHYVKDVYDDHFIYERISQNESTLFKQKYSVSDDGNIQMNGEPKEVRVETKYIETTTTNEGGERKMEKVKQLVNGLISNEATKFTEDDRKFLEGLTECQLEKLEPVKNEVKKPCEDMVTKLIANEASPFEEKDRELLSSMSEEQFKSLAEKYPEKKNESKANDNDKPITAEEYVSNAPVEIQDYMKTSINLHKAQKEVLVKELMANKRNKFTEEQLRVMELGNLQKLAELSQIDIDYSGQIGAATMADDEGEVLELPKMEFK